MMEAVAVASGYVPEPAELPGSPEWLARLRRSAFAEFEKRGFPTPHDEAWRYTGIQPITGPAWTRGPASLRPPALPGGARLRPLAEVPEREIAPYLARIASLERPFAALNTAALEEAYVLEIPAGAILSEPITLDWTSAARRPEVTHPRVLILAGNGSQAAVVENFTGEGRYFRNAVTEIALSDRAILEHYTLQRESPEACHVHTIAARQGRASHFTSHNLAFGAALARTDVDVRLDAEGAECTLNGLFAGAGTQHLDNHTTIDHAKPHCTSRELYKGVMDGASRGVFFGKIIVRPDAQKTDAIQTNKNLLLSREALVNSTPALEIFADDVKCKHGSTTGQLDALALFYLRSRGIGEREARTLLTQAFAADVAERLRVPAVRDAVAGVLAQRLGAALTPALSQREREQT
jgi:Fe-S cluster assembly protein SufD